MAARDGSDRWGEESIAFSFAQTERLESDLLGSDLRQREFEIIAETLRRERGSKKNTAERLGISPRTLRYKLARFREEGYDLEALAGF